MSAAFLDDVVAAALQKERRIADSLGNPGATPCSSEKPAPAAPLCASAKTPVNGDEGAKGKRASNAVKSAKEKGPSNSDEDANGKRASNADKGSKGKGASNGDDGANGKDIPNDDKGAKGNGASNDEKGANGDVTSKKRKKRSRPAADAGSNWKKLKATLDAENADSEGGGRNKEWLRKKREREMAKRKQSEQPSTAVGDDGAGDVGHSQFARRQVATRNGALTKVIALDCEMVEIAGGQDALARVSLVNVRGDVVYDEFVAVKQRVVDYRTAHSGVTAEHLEKGVGLTSVRSAVSDMLQGRILVGHALRNDLRVLALSHPKHMTRDTVLYFRRGRNRPKLAYLVAAKLGVDSFQKGSHDSAEDARAALALYKKFASEWEASLRGASRKDGRNANEAKDGSEPRT